MSDAYSILYYLTESLHPSSPITTTRRAWSPFSEHIQTLCSSQQCRKLVPFSFFLSFFFFSDSFVLFVFSVPPSLTSHSTLLGICSSRQCDLYEKAPPPSLLYYVGMEERECSQIRKRKGVFGTESRERFSRYETSYVCVISSRSQPNFLPIQPSRLIYTASPIDAATMRLRQVIAS